LPIPALAGLVAVTIGGIALEAAANKTSELGDAALKGGMGNVQSGFSPTFMPVSEPPESFPLVETSKMDGYRVKVRGRMSDPATVQSIGSMFENFDVSDIRNGVSLSRVESLMNRTRS